VSNGFRNVLGIPPVEKEGQVLTSTISGVVWETPPGQILRSTWKYTTKTNPDVAGDITLNAGTWAAATQVKMSKVSAGGVDVTTIVGTFQVNDTLFIQDSADASKWGKYSITGGFSDQGSWGYFPVKYLESTGAVPSNNAGVLMLAEVGASGGGSSSISDATVTNLTGLLVGNGTDVDALPVIDDLHLPPRLQTQGPLITDFNTVNMSGWYRPNNAANGPPGATPYGMLFHDAWDGANGHSFQLFNAMNDNTLWWRACITYAWQAWKKISPIDDANLPARLRTGGSGNASVSDWNNATASGWYVGLSAANSPPGLVNWGIGLVSAYDSAWIRQDVYAMQAGPPQGHWVRFNQGNAWQAWQTYTPGDDSLLPLRLRSIGPLVTDCNTVLASGWGYTQSGVSANTPYGASASAGPWGVLETVMMNGTDNGIQRFWTYNTDFIFHRRRWNSAWQAWQQSWPIDTTNLPARLGQGGTAVPGNDWNNAVTNGWYIGSGSANAPPSPNYNYWEVMVTAWDATNHCAQLAFALFEPNNPVYYRNRVSTSWSAWKKVAPIDDENLPDRLDSLSSQPADNNSVQVNGWHYANGNSNMPPGDSQWYMQTMMWSGGGYATQIAHALSSNTIYKRRQVASSWQAWQKVSPSDDTNLPARLAGATVYASDLNAVYENGWYPWSGSTTNSPAPGFYGHCLVFNLGSGNVLQQAWRYNTNDAWMRRRADSGAWGAWIQTWPVMASVRNSLAPASVTYSISDWNSAVENGWYTGADCANAPAGGWMLGEAVVHNSIWVEQTVWAFTGGTPQSRWRRVQNNGTWEAWVQIDAPWIDITLNGGQEFYNVGGGWPNCGVRLAGGIVSLRGLFYRPGPISGGSTIGWLPSAFVPSSIMMFNVRCSGGSVRLDVQPDTAIVIQDWSGDPSSYTSLAGITFAR